MNLRTPCLLSILAAAGGASAQTFTSQAAWAAAAGATSYTETFETVPVAKSGVCVKGSVESAITLA